jgi:hypothetical protein
MTELHCIMPIKNIPSVMQYGILSNERSAQIPHDSVAMTEIQERRDNVHVPSGLRLHQYANLYFHARNPMMYKRKNQANTLCILRVSCDVLKGDNVVLADQNASSDYVRFLSPNQLRLIDFDLVYAADWTHPGDPIAYYRHKARMCAEVLVPNYVPSECIIGAYVLNQTSQNTLLAIGFNLPITINPYLFFY